MRIGRRKKDAVPPAASDPKPPSRETEEPVDTADAETQAADGGLRSSAPQQGDEDAAQSHGPDASDLQKPNCASRRKWKLLGFLSLIIVVGLAVTVARNRFSVPEDWTSTLIERDPLPGTVQEEKLAPFFLPMPEGGADLAIRLDVLVRWDRGTGARFKKEAPWIRAKVYERLMGVTQEGGAASEKRDRLEREIAVALRRSLGDKDIQVVMEQIRVL